MVIVERLRALREERNDAAIHAPKGALMATSCPASWPPPALDQDTL